jgi:hypothetical protein
MEGLDAKLGHGVERTGAKARRVARGAERGGERLLALESLEIGYVAAVADPETRHMALNHLKVGSSELGCSSGGFAIEDWENRCRLVPFHLAFGALT